MTTDRHRAASSRLVDYALGEVSPLERAEIERHLQECAECATEVRELTLVMHGLADAVDPVAPPPALKQRVLDTLAREPREAQSGPVPPHVRRDVRGWSGGWLALAAALILGLGTLLYLSVNRTRQLDRELEQAQSEIADVRGRLDEFTGQTDLALSILTAGDMRRIELAPSSTSPSAARAYWSPTRGLLVVADELPVPPPGRVYQVWLIGGGAPVSAGLLGTPRTGRGMLIAPPPGGIAGGPVTVAVTDEPPGGLSAPTGAKHLIGSL